MRRWMVLVAGVVALGLIAGGVSVAGSDYERGRGRVLRFLDVSGEVEYLDLGPPAEGDFDPSPGDTFFFSNTLRNLADTKTKGRFVSKCTALIGTEFRCLGTLMLEQGNIELATTVDFAAEEPLVAAVTGGTGKYRGVGGEATITPTETEGVSKLVVKLTR